MIASYHSPVSAAKVEIRLAGWCWLFGKQRRSMLGAALIALLAGIISSCGQQRRSNFDQLALRDTVSVTDPGSGLTEFRDCPECPKMVTLPVGQFLMRSRHRQEEVTGELRRQSDSFLYEQPQVHITVSHRLAIGKTEVTFAEWDFCISQSGCSYRPADEGWGRGDRPVVNIARRDAEQYVRWLSGHTRQPYRLTSEGEWEYAARAGTSTLCHWDDVVGNGRTVWDGCGTEWDGRKTAPVGSFAPNPFGLHDMLGNATEWVADCWNPTHTGAPENGSARTRDLPSPQTSALGSGASYWL